MLKESPLLHRARKEHTKKEFHIPHRGRIRFALLFIIVCITLWFFKKRTSSSDRNNPIVANVKIEKTDKSTRQESIIEKVKKKIKIKNIRTLSFDNIRELMNNSPMFLANARDTISFKKGKLIIHYSIDTALQRLGKEYLKQYHPKYGAITAIEPATGRVLACISYTCEGEASLGNNLFCRSIFPAASIFKIVTTAGAIEKAGLTADTELRTLGANHTLYHSQLVEEPEFCRKLSLREAFAYSVNPVFGRIGIYLLGADGLKEYATKFGFNAKIPFELDNEKPSFFCPDTGFALAEMASGFNQKTLISPLFGAMISAGISNKGRICTPSIIDSVIDMVSMKNVYTRHKSIWRMPIQPGTSEKLVLLMKEVPERGTARKSFRYFRKSYRFNKIDYGGKTGNIDKDSLGRVDWFVGFCRHKSDNDQEISTGVVTVHDDNWTVHSSFIGAEIMRNYIRKIQIAKKANREIKIDSLTEESINNDDTIPVADNR